MKTWNFKNLPISEQKYGKKNIDQACKNTVNNEFLIELAKRLADK